MGYGTTSSQEMKRGTFTVDQNIAAVASFEHTEALGASIYNRGILWIRVKNDINVHASARRNLAIITITDIKDDTICGSGSADIMPIVDYRGRLYNYYDNRMQGFHFGTDARLSDSTHAGRGTDESLSGIQITHAFISGADIKIQWKNNYGSGALILRADIEYQVWAR